MVLIKFRVISIGTETETTVTNDLAKGDHVNEEKWSKHRTLRHTLVNQGSGRARAFHCVWLDTMEGRRVLY